MRYLQIIILCFIFSCSNTVTEYFPNGKLRYTGMEEDGHKTGTWEYFDETGKKVAMENYRADTLLAKIEFSQNGYLQIEYQNKKSFKIQSFSIDRGDTLLDFVQYPGDSLVLNSYDSLHNLVFIRTQSLKPASFNSTERSFEKGVLVRSEIRKEVKDSIVETTRCVYYPKKECSSYWYDYKTKALLSKRP